MLPFIIANTEHKVVVVFIYVMYMYVLVNDIIL